MQGPNPPFSYQWSPSTGLDDPTSDTPEASPTQTTTYEVVVTDANGCESIDEVTVTVHPRPIAEAGDDVDICFGESIMIGGNATSGTPPFEYQWTPATGLDDPTIAQPEASPDDSTTYIVTVTDSEGCINSDTVNVNVWPLPEPVIIPDGPLRFCECDSVILDAGAEYIDYLWSTGETSQTIIVRDDGDYTVTVTDSNGCVNTSPPVTVSIIRPTATIALPQTPVRSEPGMMVTIPLELLESSKLDSCNAFDFSAEISLNRSILVPKGTTDQGALNGDTRTISVTGTRISGNQLLAELDFRSTLGNVEFTDMVIDNFVFNDCFFDVETLDGQFYLDSLCREGGTTRLFMAEGTLSMAVMPNPADDKAEIAVSLPKDTYYSIKIYDLLGKRIRSVAEGSARKGSLITSADLRDIRPGVYMLVLTIDNGSVTNILEVK